MSTMSTAGAGVLDGPSGIQETQNEPWRYVDDHQATISFSQVVPVDVQVRDLEVGVKAQASIGESTKKALRISKKRKELQKGPGAVDAEKGLGTSSQSKKTIIQGISADFPTGTLSAIIGGSGSGKTTMLNILSHRMRGSNLRVHGSVLYNGSPELSTITNAYVTQTDVLLPTLTVRETLTYAAELRLPSSVNASERQRLVEEIILELGLKECANTVVGDGYRRRGCSGGERRRVSIGVQMLANPSVLWLDEPTTGLDATSAYQLVNTLKHLASKGRTIVTTIHQPRSDIFFLFDRITVLTRGRCTYSGPTSECLPWFEVLLPKGLREHVNPADYLIDISSVDTRTPVAELETQSQVDRLISAWEVQSGQTFSSTSTQRHAGSTSSLVSARGARVKHSAPLYRQIRVLTSRTILTTYRDPMGLMASWAEGILMGLVGGLVFLHLPKTSSGIRSREGALYISASLQGYLFLLFETYRITGVDISLFDRERGEGVVGVVAWLVSRRLARALLEDILVPFVFSVIFYFMCAFEANAQQFLTFFAVVLVNHFIAVSLATFCAAVSRDFSVATLVGNLVFTIQSFACGYFIQADTMPVYVRWLKYLSYVYFAFGALASNEFTDSFYDCPTGDPRTDPNCITYRGDYILSSLSFHQNWKTVPICVMVAFAAFFTIASMLLLKYWTVDIHVSSQQKSTTTEEEKAGAASAKDKTEADLEVEEAMRKGGVVRKVDVRLVKYALEISKPAIFGFRRSRRFNILKGVSTIFEAGKLNIIMGPSGSGKSSLLNLMSLRLRSSLSTRYQSAGSMLFNGIPPADADIRSLVSYVTQDDAGLLSYLTVREMLRFSAGLRLPKEMSTEEKLRKAEEVILKFGLRDCADNLIGDEIVKGISGGEKRRVSIAIQVLTEPCILILDEPTSGLDAFTAASILDVLKALAEEGRTVISTIHQGRSDLFAYFGNVLLLAKGGEVAYSGTAQDMLPHFAKLGYTCAPEMNPADFALDLVSVDLREAHREEVSRKKVKRLTAQFDVANEKEQENDVVTRTSMEVETRRKSQLVSAELTKMRRDMAPFYVAYPILLRRGLLGFYRRPDLMAGRLGQVLGLAIIIAVFFAPLGNDYFSVQNRLGLIQEILPVYFVGMLQNVALYPSERDVFYREHDDRAYTVEAFFLSYLTLELPLEIVACLMFSSLVAIAVDLRRTVAMFFIVTLNAVCIVSSGESIGIIFNTVFSSSTGFALNITSTVLSIGTFMAGLVSIDMPGFLRALNYLSPLKYAAANLVVYTFHGFNFTCTDAQRLADGSCPINTGDEVLELYGYGSTNPGRNLAYLVVTTVIYRFLAYALLRVTRMHLGIGQKRAS